jgi:GntR family transcriptional regulator
VLDKNAFVPLYAQIQRALMDKIQSGELKEGDPLHSEEELSRQFHVSRMTARHALNGLKANGYAVSERGRGTFVTRPKFEKNVLHLQGFTEEISKKGMRPASKVLEHAVIEPEITVRENLKLATGEKVLCLKRLRLADDIPMAIEESNIPLRFFPGIDRINFANHSLYRVLRQDYGVRYGYADEVIESLPATQEEAAILTIPKKACILCVRRTIITVQETPIEYALSKYRGDRYRISLRVPVTSVE